MTTAILLFGITLLTMESRMEEVLLLRQRMAAEADNAACGALLGGPAAGESLLRSAFPEEMASGRMKARITREPGKAPRAEIILTRKDLRIVSEYRMERNMPCRSRFSIGSSREKEEETSISGE